MSTTSVMPSARYSRAKTTRLMMISLVLTDGETPSVVFISPWTIHGWRPFSVSIQPAVFITKGVTRASIGAGGTLLDPGLPRRSSHAPHSDKAATAVARYAITRIDQYWTNT